MINPNEIYQRLMDAGEDWAEKDHAARQLEKQEKQVLSKKIIEYMAQGKSKTSAEVFALADPEYSDFQKTVCEARHEAVKSKVRYESAQAWFDAERTRHATLRHEMKHLHRVG